MLLVTFVMSSMASDVIVISQTNMTGSAADASGTPVANNKWTGNSGTDLEGWSVQITGNTGKGLTGQSNVTYNSTSYGSFKNSNGAEMTITRLLTDSLSSVLICMLW